MVSGIHAPLSAAFMALNQDTFEPFDLGKNPERNILEDRMFALLLHLARSGLVGPIWAAPPCKEVSRLKLRQPGPKALRAPSQMDGVPGLTAAERRRVDESAAIHACSRHVLRAAFDSSAQGLCGRAVPLPGKHKRRYKCKKMQKTATEKWTPKIQDAKRMQK